MALGLRVSGIFLVFFSVGVRVLRFAGHKEGLEHPDKLTTFVTQAPGFQYAVRVPGFGFRV